MARAIVWQDRRTADFCREQRGRTRTGSAQRTGLVLDPYFSATKLRWLLQQDASLRARAEAGQLACGTIDSFLVWRLTGGRVHATDRTNASRTLLLNLTTARWDDDLCRYFDVPPALLPEVRPSAADFGTTAGLGVSAGRRADPRRGRRPAGGAVRPGRLRAGRGEMHLRHRRVLPAAPRRQADAVASTDC